MKKPMIISRGPNTIKITRTKAGLFDIQAQNSEDFLYAQGITHAIDRSLQLTLMRIVGRGRLAENLGNDQNLINFDIKMRSLGLYRNSKKEIKELSPNAKSHLEAYLDGINSYLKVPLELKLLGIKKQDWQLEDILMTMKLMSYMGLAQTQYEVENLIFQSLKNSVNLEKLKDLFSPHLDDLAPMLSEHNLSFEKYVDILKSVKVHNSPIPPTAEFLSTIPVVKASNNWTLSANKSETNSPLICFDPHLEINRLPAIWYEFKGRIGDGKNSKEMIGINTPGVPGMVMGKTPSLSYSLTYGFMDMLDLAIEKVESSQYVRLDKKAPLAQINETIKVKNSQDIVVYFYENDYGVLETDHLKEELPDGRYIVRQWSAYKNGAASSIDSLINLLNAQTVDEAQASVSNIILSANWLLTDENNIIYQQSGLFPKKSHNGVLPLLLELGNNQWDGFVPANELLHEKNPDQGYFATANNMIPLQKQNQKYQFITLPMAEYRIERIHQLLNEKEKFNIQDMKRIQSDRISLQAKKYLELISPLLNDFPIEQDLKNWDFGYNKESREATYFDTFYWNLHKELIGADFLGKDVWSELGNDTAILIDYYGRFDQVFFDNSSTWFSEKSRDQYIEDALNKTRQHFSNHTIKSWGKQRQTKMKHLALGDKLPFLPKLNYGPIPIEGCGATIVQGGVYQSGGRVTTFCPSYRMITEHKSNNAYTALAGGISDRFWSKFYTLGINEWLNLKYKKISF